MSRKPVAIVSTILVGLLAAGHARADIPAEFRRLWDDPAVTARIEQDTEQYRKADAVIHVVDAQGQPIRDAKVQAEQQTHEFLFGCNLFVLGQLDTPELNAKYEKAFTRIFNFATLPFYWGDLEPEQGKPRFAEGSAYIWRRPPPDLLLQWCKAHDITAKGHALLYAKNMFMPEWTVRDDPEVFMKQARRHMAELAERYGRQIPVWDVINEEIPRVAHLDQWHVVPDDYALQCFQEANRLFPEDVKLLINDGTTQTHVTLDECEANVKKLLDGGARVDGIGIQFHTSRGALLSSTLHPPKRMVEVYDRLGQLGLSLYITEITIPGTGEDGPAFQAAAAANLYRLWFSTPKMAGVTWWNLGDGTAFGGENSALGGLLDKNMDSKPAFDALDRLINHEWKTTAESTTGADGSFVFRGFKGGYRLTVDVSGITQEFTIDVTDSAKPHKIVFENQTRQGAAKK
jgi:GH35 family endo-1,4-beta-xylanase